MMSTKSKGILFQGAMVKAILAGQKKMTRRMVKPNSPPYCAAGDLLWVRETWGITYPQYLHDRRDDGSLDEPTFYRADYSEKELKEFALPRWRPSIHLPKERSRLNLPVLFVRREPIIEISDEDCIKEGIQKIDAYNSLYGVGNEILGSSPKEAFKALWVSINGAEKWASHILVDAIEFQ